MNGIRGSSLIRFSGLALLAACFVAGHANAQVFRGKFTLPFQARWGGATLPAGDYSFTLESRDTAHTLTVSREGKGVAMILVQSYDQTYSGRTELTVEESTVRTLRLPEIGMILQFAPPHTKHLAVPEERQLSQTVPVTTAGK
jgi:hypothetical protein